MRAEKLFSNIYLPPFFKEELDARNTFKIFFSLLLLTNEATALNNRPIVFQGLCARLDVRAGADRA